MARVRKMQYLPVAVIIRKQINARLLENLKGYPVVQKTKAYDSAFHSKIN